MPGIDTLDKVIPFRITASEAEALSRLDTLKAHNLPISHQDTAPFSVSVSNAYPAGHKSRFSLPLLSFQREPVALAGFRNKDGFVLIRSGLPEQVERAVISRFNSLIQLTKQSLRALREEQRDLDERAQSVMTANGEPIMEMKGYKINRYAYSDGHVQTHLQPSQVHNRLTLAFPDSVKGRHVRGGAFMLSVETPAFNLVKVLLTFHKTHHGTHIVTGNGNEGLVLRNIVAGQEKLETSLILRWSGMSCAR